MNPGRISPTLTRKTTLREPRVTRVTPRMRARAASSREKVGRRVTYCRVGVHWTRTWGGAGFLVGLVRDWAGLLNVLVLALEDINTLLWFETDSTLGGAVSRL